MRLKNCHIENYGKFTKTDFSFEEDITQFCEMNGFGKTTLASFIRAMFYGLPTAKENAKDFNDRKRFYPFGGGKFGGNLTFETDGKEYRIERFFDKKSETKDECAVYCGGRPYDGFGSEIGRAVFGLDKDSFERTVFITSDAVDVLATSSINAKLNDFVDDTADGVSFDDALGKLEKAKKQLKAAKGSNDLISRTQTEIINIQNAINNIESIASGLEDLYSRSGKLKGEIRDLEKRRDEASAENLLIERWNAYETMLARKTADGQALKELEGGYPCGIPTDGQLASMKQSSNEIIRLTGRKQSAGFDEIKSARLSVLSEAFSVGVPDEDGLQGVRRDIDRVKELELKINSQKSVVETERERQLRQNFGRGIPTDAEVERVAASAERYGQLDRELKISSAPDEEVKPKRSGKIFIIIAVIAAIVVAAGAGLLFVNTVAGGVVIGAGAAGLLATGFVYLKNANPARPVRINENAVKLQAEMKGIEDAVREFLVPYSYYSKNGIVFDFAEFSRDLRDYKRLIQDNAAAEESLKAMQTELSSLTEGLNGYFTKYKLPVGDLQKNYLTLQTSAAEYASLTEEKLRAEREVAAVDEKLEMLRAGIERVYAEYKLPLPGNVPSGIETLERHSAEMQRLRESIAAAEAEAGAYARKYNLTEKPQGCTSDVSEITAAISEKQRESAALDGKIAEAESYAEQLDDKKIQLERSRESLEEYKQRHKILTASIDMLKTAENNLKEKYVAPIKDKFLGYAEVIESTLGEKVSLDRNFGISFERGGETRSDRHLSAGQRSICALCMRIALIDNMFGGEKPFIIMDDPFVNLDGKHMQKTADAVKKIAKDRQIIYFCCHESRKI